MRGEWHSLAAGLSLRSGAKEGRGEGCARGSASRISRFTLSRSPVHPRSTISRTKQPPGQVPFECLRNRRFCPSSDEHHCLSICLSVYRIDIREWQDRRPCSRSPSLVSILYLTFPLLPLLPLPHSLTLSLFLSFPPPLLSPFLCLPRRQPLQARRCTFVPL